MVGIRFHGRGGQGAVVASKILANAYFKQGLYVLDLLPENWSSGQVSFLA
jgi:hypothetical protein